MDDSGKSPMFGLSQLPMHDSHVSSVEGAVLRFFMRSNQAAAWLLNVVPWTLAMDFASVSSESAPDAATICLALRLRSDSVRTLGPEIGHILSLMYILCSCP